MATLAVPEDDCDDLLMLDFGESETASVRLDSPGHQNGYNNMQASCGLEDLDQDHLHINQLNAMVSEIKAGFGLTMEHLERIQSEDDRIKEEMNSQREETVKRMERSDRRMEDLSSAMDILREQMSELVVQINALTESSQQLQAQVQLMQSGPQMRRHLNDLRIAQQNGSSRENGRVAATDSLPLSRSTSSSDHTQLPPDNCRSSVRSRECSPDSGRPATSHDEDECLVGTGGAVNLDVDCSSIHPHEHDGATHASVCLTVNKSLDLSRALAERCLLDQEDQEEPEIIIREHEDQQHNLDSSEVTESDSKRSSMLSISRRTAPHEKLFKETQRNKVCQELIETERRFCSCLWTLIDLIAESLKSASCVPLKDLCLMFPKCLPRLYEVHSSFLCLLQERVRDGARHSCVAEIVLDLLDGNAGEFFDLYRSYVTDFKVAVETIRRYTKQNAKFRKLIATLQHHQTCEGLDLAAFLLTPVQRVPRYLLLMKQISNHTESEHPDAPATSHVLARLQDLLEELDESIQKALASGGLSVASRKLARSHKSLAGASSCDSLHIPFSSSGSTPHSQPPILAYGDPGPQEPTSASSLGRGSASLLSRIQHSFRRQSSSPGSTAGEHFLATSVSSKEKTRDSKQEVTAARLAQVTSPSPQVHERGRQHHRQTPPTTPESGEYSRVTSTPRCKSVPPSSRGRSRTPASPQKLIQQSFDDSDPYCTLNPGLVHELTAQPQPAQYVQHNSSPVQCFPPAAHPSYMQQRRPPPPPIPVPAVPPAPIAAQHSPRLDRSFSQGDILRVNSSVSSSNGRSSLDVVPVRDHQQNGWHTRRSQGPHSHVQCNNRSSSVGRLSQPTRRRKSSPAPQQRAPATNSSGSGLKNSFRKMFMTKRKNSKGNIEPPCGELSLTFHDENGDPCTNV